MVSRQLIEQLRTELENSSAQVSVLWQPLDGGPLFAYAEDRETGSASIIKGPIMTAALARVQRGEATLSGIFQIQPGDILPDSVAFETGPREASLEELLTWMIVSSDNTSTNVLIRWLGFREINDHIQSLGLSKTCLQREMLDFGAIAQGRNNKTCAADMYRFFKLLYGDKMLTPALCETARRILDKQRCADSLRRYVWQDVSLAHKTGGLDHLSHDAGVFTYRGRLWYLGVFAEGTMDIQGDKPLLGRIARLVFSHYESATGTKMAVIKSGIAPLYSEPTAQSELADEALYGMVVEVLDRPLPGWRYVRTHYGYEGYTPVENLLLDADAAREWQGRPKQTVLSPFTDIRKDKRVQALCLASMPRGSVVCPVNRPDEQGWQEVCLPDGETGFARDAHLGAYTDRWDTADEPSLRKAIVQTALAYMGVPYRWGGKTPQGIDCSGLTSMAYLLNGIAIYRDAAIKEGFPVKPIQLEEIQPADLLFFPGHVAMYIGDGQYIHATAHTGDDGVVLNSLVENHPRYREDLKNDIIAVGSAFSK